MTKQEILDNILKPIEQSGFKAYFVGGCVRDELLGLKPKDYDIVTNAKPNDIHTMFTNFSDKSRNSEQYGVTIILLNHEEIEIASMRKDITSGRHPKIEYANSIEEDAFRRDFTINAIYQDSNGTLYDPTMIGIKDVKERKLRFVGNMRDRCFEDPLRVLRAVRFQSKLGLIPEFDIIEFNDLSHDLLEKCMYDSISKERKLKELEGIFGGLQFDMCMFDEQELIMPSLTFEIIGLRRIIDSLMLVKQSFKWHAEGALIRTTNDDTRYVYNQSDLNDFDHIINHGDAWSHTYYVMEHMFYELNKANITDQHTRFIMILSAFLHDIGKITAYETNKVKTNTFTLSNGKTMTETLPTLIKHDYYGKKMSYDICKELGMSNYDSELISELTARHMIAHKLNELKHKSKLWSFVKWEHFDKLIMLVRADEAGCIKTVEDNWISLNESLNDQQVKLLMSIDMPKQIITGQTLINYGYKPNESFKKMIDKAYQIQIDNDITDEKSLVNRVKCMYQNNTKKD